MMLLTALGVRIGLASLGFEVGLSAHLLQRPPPLILLGFAHHCIVLQHSPLHFLLQYNGEHNDNNAIRKKGIISIEMNTFIFSCSSRALSTAALRRVSVGMAKSIAFALFPFFINTLNCIDSPSVRELVPVRIFA
jgi:hypothetical protein